jgi:Mu-like prophage I protein
MLETAVVEAPAAEEISEDTNEAWIEALPARVYRTPQYGEIPVGVDKLQRFITNFRAGVRGQEIATDYEHGRDTAKGLQASGWYRDFDIRPSSADPNQFSLYAKVKFTDDAVQDIRSGKYKYWSLEWDDEYETDDGAIVPDVVIGGGLTNRPVAKRTMPINFSEDMWNDLSDDDKKYAQRIVQERKLLSELKPETRKAYDTLRARGFEIRLSEAAMEHSDPGIGAPLYASAQDQPDPGTGQPVPRVTGDAATDDIAIASQSRRDPLPNTSNIPGDEPETRQPSGREIETGVIVPASKNFNEYMWLSPLFDSNWTARKFADDSSYLQTAKQALEKFLQDETTEQDSYDAQECQVLISRINGLMDKEKSEPDYESEMSSTAKAASEFINSIVWKGGKKVKFTEEQVNTLKDLGIEVSTDDDADADKFMETVTTAFSELKQFKDAVGGSSKEREFAEMFPEQHRQMQELAAKNRTTDAKAFSESVARVNKAVGEGDSVTFEPTRSGLSALALNTLAEKHTKFAEGTGTLEDFEEAVKTITNGGIVEFGEVGSSFAEEDDDIMIDGTTPQGIANARKLFSEKVAEVQARHAKENDGEQLGILEATNKAAEKYPELAKAYRATAA